MPSLFVRNWIFLLLVSLLGTSALAESERGLDAAKKKKKPAKTVPVVPPSDTPTLAPTPEPAPAVPVEAKPAEPTPAPLASPTPDEKMGVDTKTETVSATDGGGLLGPVTFGPAITAIGFPTPFRFGLETKYEKCLGLTFDYGFFPSLSFSNVKLKYNSWRLTGRFFPFQGSFFIGFGYGKQNFDGSMSNVISGTTVNYNLSVNTTLLLPHLGWRWIADSGFFFGMELGVQLAASSEATFSSDAPAAIQATSDYTNAKNDIEDKGKTFGQTTLPHFALVQLGWMF